MKKRTLRERALEEMRYPSELKSQDKDRHGNGWYYVNEKTVDVLAAISGFTTHVIITRLQLQRMLRLMDRAASRKPTWR